MAAFDVGAEPGQSRDPVPAPHPLRSSLGDVQTTLSHPCSTSHRGQDPLVLERLGITPGLIRLSVGLEDVEDLWADLAEALDNDPRGRQACRGLSASVSRLRLRLDRATFKQPDGTSQGDLDPVPALEQGRLDLQESLLQQEQLEEGKAGGLRCGQQTGGLDRFGVRLHELTGCVIVPGIGPGLQRGRSSGRIIPGDRPRTSITPSKALCTAESSERTMLATSRRGDCLTRRSSMVRWLPPRSR